MAKPKWMEGSSMQKAHLKRHKTNALYEYMSDPRNKQKSITGEKPFYFKQMEIANGKTEVDAGRN